MQRNIRLVRLLISVVLMQKLPTLAKEPMVKIIGFLVCLVDYQCEQLHIHAIREQDSRDMNTYSQKCEYVNENPAHSCS